MIELPLLFRHEPARPADDERAFDAYAAQLTAQLGVLTAAAMLAFTLAWWPVDRLVERAPAHIAAFSTLRVRAVLIEVTGGLAMLRWPWAQRRATALAGVVIAAFLGSIGHALGALGSEGLGYLGDACLGVVPVAFVPMPLARRVPMTVMVGAALAAGFFLPFPANARVEGAGAQASFIVFAVLFSLTVGEMTQRVTRRAFFQRRELDRANASLAALTGSLTAQVAARTEQLRALATHLDGALESERRRIARDLHDDLGQRLTALRYTVARLESRVAQRTEAVDLLFEDLSALLEGAAETARGFVAALRPRVLDDEGLVAAAQWLCARTAEASGVRCALTVAPGFPRGVDRPSAGAALALFRVAQEAITNALKHAAPKGIDVSLDADGDRYAVTVRDDGAGFDVGAAHAGFGLLGMRERVHARGGELTVTAAPGAGTTVRAALRDDAEGAL
ncbi:MAG: sensor histidine kinase [Polyangiales bacterium]